jgi:hypothetical protein
VPGFVSAEISFAYADNPTDTWFQIAVNSQPVIAGNLASWDTTTITDGTYCLRLRVYLSDGTFLDVIVPDLRVRNYTPVETITPAPTLTPTATPQVEFTATLLPTTTPTATPSPIATPFPTPTALPVNPAALTPQDIYASIGSGAVVAMILFFIFEIYRVLRKYLN